MYIRITCPCGATFEAKDDAGTYIMPGRGKRPDEKGRLYQIEVMKDEWLALHANCLAAIRHRIDP